MPLFKAQGAAMAHDLQALLKEQEALTAKIQKAREESRASAIEQIRKIIAEADLTYQDFQSAYPQKEKVKTTTRKTPVVKYRDEHGNSWTGRGALPRWIVSSGKPKEVFLVK